MSSNLKIDLDSESEKLRNDMMNANTLEEVLAIEEKIKKLESKTNKFVESLDNDFDLVESLDVFDLNEIKNIETQSDNTLTSFKSPVDSENKYYIIKIETSSGKTTIEYYQDNKEYGRREMNADNTFNIYQIDEDGNKIETTESLVDDNTLTRILEVSEKLKIKIKDLDDKQRQASINIIEGKEEEQARIAKESGDTSKVVEKELKFALSPDNGFCQVNSNENTYINPNIISNKKLITLGPENKNVEGTEYPLNYSLLNQVKFTTDFGTNETINYPRFKFGDGNWSNDNQNNKFFFLKLQKITIQTGAGQSNQVTTNILEFANWENIFSQTNENNIEIEHAYKVKYKDSNSATDTERIGFIGITLIKKEDMPPVILEIEKPDKMKIGDNSLFISVNDIDNENSDITLSIENLSKDLGTLTFKERKNDKFEYKYNLTKNNKDHAMIKISVTSNGKTVTRTIRLEIEDKIPVITSLDTEYTINKYGVARLTNFAVEDSDNTEIEIIITKEPEYGDFFTIYSGGNRAFSYRNTSIPSSNSDKKFTDTFKLQAQSGRSKSVEKTVTITINADSSVQDGSAEFKVNFLN